VARFLNGATETGPVVLAREIEYPLTAEARERCRIEAERPELYFCRDLEGYGWCFRKGDFLNVGLGRRDPRTLGRHVDAFVDWLVEQGRLPRPPEKGWRGHAYGLRAGRPRRPGGDGVLLVGDAAGLAFSASGEGIGPRVARPTPVDCRRPWVRWPPPGPCRLPSPVSRGPPSLPRPGLPAGSSSTPGFCTAADRCWL
jgi:hypothetical protein